ASIPKGFQHRGNGRPCRPRRSRFRRIRLRSTKLPSGGIEKVFTPTSRAIAGARLLELPRLAALAAAAAPLEGGDGHLFLAARVVRAEQADQGGDRRRLVEGDLGDVDLQRLLEPADDA